MRDRTVTLLRKSASDEQVLGMDGFSPHIAMFHGQQAIEKLLKAWLFALGVEAPQDALFQEVGDSAGTSRVRDTQGGCAAWTV
jgi:hypothetical protein